MQQIRATSGSIQHPDYYDEVSSMTFSEWTGYGKSKKPYFRRNSQKPLLWTIRKRCPPCTSTSLWLGKNISIWCVRYSRGTIPFLKSYRILAGLILPLALPRSTKQNTMRQVSARVKISRTSANNKCVGQTALEAKLWTSHAAQMQICAVRLGRQLSVDNFWSHDPIIPNFGRRSEHSAVVFSINRTIMKHLYYLCQESNKRERFTKAFNFFAFV